jgi:hypothetical protein
MKISTTIVTAAICLLAAPGLAADIAGVWKIDDQPGWIEISIDPATSMGTGVVRRHDSRPRAVGRMILRDAQQVEEGVWSGQIYAARLDSFQDARIEMSGADSLAIKVRVGMMSRTLSWSRAAAEALAAD